MSKAQCLDCEDILESKHRHDFVTCKCGNSFLDGGEDYFRGGGNLLPLFDEVFSDNSLLDDDFDDYNLGYQAGTLDERERIIKLLEPHAEHRDCELGCYPEDCSAPSYLYAIELIKGETDG